MRRPTPSFVVASAALLVALSGTGYAAGLIGTQDIKDNSIRSKDVKDGGLRAVDFRAGELPAGAPGAQGVPGAPGEAGPQGPAGVGRWALIDASGAIVASSGGFEVKAAYGVFQPVADPPVATPGGAVANVYIDANEPLDDNGIVVTVALQNTLEQNGNMNVNGLAAGPDANPEFSGEITASQCLATAGMVAITNCAPAGTNNIEHFVVSPRMSDGSPTTADTRKRFYVVITGDSSDYVPAP
jgi:hypothetical protein